METLEPLSTASVFFWGCVGGCFGVLVTATLPWLNARFQAKEKPSLIEIGWGGAILLVNSVVGGFAALAMGTTLEIRQAIIHGVLWPAIYKSVGETGKDLLKK